VLWSLNQRWLEEGFRQLLDGVGAPVPDEPIVGQFRGRAAMNLDALAAAVTALPGGSRAELEREYFGQTISHDHHEESPRRSRLPRLVTVARAAHARRRLALEDAVVETAVDHVVDDEVPIGNLDAASLRSYRYRVHDLLARVVAAQVATAANAVANYRTLEGFLQRYVDDEAGEVAQHLTAGAIGSGDRLDVARFIELVGIKELERLSTSVDSLDEFVEHLRRRPDSLELAMILARARRRAGSVTVPGGHTWEEDDELTLATLRSATVRAAPDAAPDPTSALGEFEQRLTTSWRWRLQRLFTGQIVEVRRRLLRRFIDEATHLVACT
jgi:hypothetical protein